MYRNHFKFNGTFFKLKDGTSMENPLSCFVANNFRSAFERDLQRFKLFPRIWWRLFDDVFAVIKKKDYDTVLAMLNNDKYPLYVLHLNLKKAKS